MRPALRRRLVRNMRFGGAWLLMLVALPVAFAIGLFVSDDHLPPPHDHA